MGNSVVKNEIKGIITVIIKRQGDSCQKPNLKCQIAYYNIGKNQPSRDGANTC